MKVIRFTASVPPYNPGEVAGFPQDEADDYIARDLAVPHIEPGDEDDGAGDGAPEATGDDAEAETEAENGEETASTEDTEASDEGADEGEGDESDESGDGQDADPEAVTAIDLRETPVKDLPAALAEIDDPATIRALLKADDRTTAPQHYEARLAELEPGDEDDGAGDGE